MEQALASVMKNIGDALRLDNDSNDKEAYVKYLDCILCITSNLLQTVRDKGGDVVVTKEVTKQVKLAQQCVDRVVVLIDKIGSSQKPTAMVLPVQDRRTPTKPKLFISVPPWPPEPATNTFSRPKGKSPMEIAYHQNQLLMAAYRARMARMNKRAPGAANLSLTIQRKMAENLALARKQEMALAKKMQERQERLEEQAAKRFSTPIGMSEEEQEQRQIYKKILEYEQDAKWLQTWRTKLDANPEEPEPICQLIQEILRCRDHPLTVLLKQYQYKIYEKIYPLVCNKKQLLAAITVPLPESLWPPELCNGNSGRQDDHSATSGILSSGYFSSISGGSVDADSEKNESKAPAEFSSGHVKCSTTSSSGERDDNVDVDESPEAGEINDAGNEGVSSPSEGAGDSNNSQEVDSNAEGSAVTAEEAESSPGYAEETASNEDQESIPRTGSNASHDSFSNPDDNTPDECESNDTKEDAEPSHEVEGSPEDLSVSQSESKASNSEKTGLSQNTCDNTSDVASENAREGDKNQNADNSSSITGPDRAGPVSYTQQTKSDVSAAIAKGQKLQERLKDEQNTAARVLRQASSASSLRDAGPDSLVSRSSSSGSVQDFPSLPSVSEDQAEIQRMSREAYQRHLKNIATDVHQYMEKMLILFTIAYEQLDSPLGRDQCYASLEETFFKPLWKFLLMLFRLANYKDELAFACKMTQRANTTPMEMGVTRRLCLIPTGDDAAAKRSHPQPYQKAIEELVRIKDHYTMLSKLECVVKVMKLILDGIKDFYLSQGYTTADVPSVGADDLLPVVSYVVMKTNLPQLVSECHAMAEFIHEGYIMGQEGYCLTTLETAVSYIVSSDLLTPCSPT
ncbi:hypothetical protein BaRGS_00009740 [Batillaria attramentaria]|uniref:VPS9 domain-containing protein n=1 Tax=Batillaria attramentaria TaxID=370345 RepID=A0ABD0LI72_9CAEN